LTPFKSAEKQPEKMKLPDGFELPPAAVLILLEI
jgi:hypothetical protein